MRTKTPVMDRLMAKVEKTETCWIWQGTEAGSGYGQIRDEDGSLRVVHRIVYEHLVGSIPEGLQIDHLCRVRLCVNPAHLEPVTPAVNVQRATPDTCRQGHPFDSRTTTQRTCRICRNAAWRRWKARQKENQT